MPGDLHTHTTYSDGSTPVAKLPFLARCAGMTHLAISDHDSIQSVRYAYAHPVQDGVHLIPATELTAYDYERAHRVHLLCYWPDDCPALEDFSRMMAERRYTAMMQSSKELEEICPQYSTQEALEFAKDSGTLYKAHIMRVLWQYGLADGLYNEVYRSLFGVDSLSVHGVYTPYPAAKYGSMKDDPYAPQMIGTWLELDRMTRLLYQESKSLDQLEVMAKSKELMADAIPAIWPIDRRNLRGHIGAFGSRVHPISGRISGHQGIDLGGRTGNPVYATGDGTVAFNNEGVRGYGLQVLIDHGFGYKTRYAHLSKILVSPGQKVKRGELIGEVGSTGRSTGPHLHYEVIYRGQHVDPINYFSRDMTEAEFEKIIESARATTYETE